VASVETADRALSGSSDDGVALAAPAAVRIVDLDAPLTDVGLPARPLGAPYRSLVAVARFGGDPLGAATLSADAHGCVSRERLAVGLYSALDGQFPAPGIAGPANRARKKRGRPHSLSVVVTTRANPLRLERCLLSIIRCDYEPHEIIVVENLPGLAPTRRVLVERFEATSGLRYVEESRKGLSHARNAGLAIAEGDIVAFTTDDTVVDPGWLRRSIEAIESSDDVACVTGLILPVELETDAQLRLERCAGFCRAFRRQTYRLEGGTDLPVALPYASCATGFGANMAVRADVAREVGWFDVSLGAGTLVGRGEDLDLYVRLLRDGRAVAYEPSAIVWRARSNGTAQLRRRAYRYGVGVGAVRTKHRLDGHEPSSAPTGPNTVHFSRQLDRLERLGTLAGPASYLVSRAMARGRSRRVGRAHGRADGARTPVELLLRSGERSIEVVSFRRGEVARPPGAPGWERREALEGRGARAPGLTVARPQARPWGAMPMLMLIAAVGLALVTVGDALSRAGAGDGRPLFWAGVIAIVMPIAYRLACEDVARGERVALLSVFGLALYGVKFVRDPFAFTYADELVHVANVDAILRTGHLLTPNSILPVTPLYPGLENVTAALASLTGFSPFAAGVVIVGVGRVLLTLGFYLFVEVLTGSARTGGIAALVYAAAPNYIFFTGQYSYESLSLPLGVLALFALARCLRATTSRDSFGWGGVVVVVTAAIVVTHHMTSYVLLAFLVAVAALTAVVPGVRSRRPPWLIAGAAGAMTALWLLTFASRTDDYLVPIIKGAITATFDTVSGEVAVRTLFRPEAGPSPPFWEHGVGIGAVVVLILIMPFGLRTVWGKFRTTPMVVALATAGMLYVATLPLRLVPGAWETASRASEFLFVGVAVVVALAGIERWGTTRAPHLGRWVVAAVAGLLISGGIIAGTPSAQRLAQTYRIQSGDRAIDPEGVSTARWAGAHLGPGNRFAAEHSDARLLQLYGRQFAIAGSYPDVQDILHAQALEPWMRRLLQEERIRYVSVNRLQVSESPGLYFFSPPWSWTAALLPGPVVGKFDRDARAERVFDSGYVAIYDIRAMTHD
jgi:GT2 family glycosyltransferase